MTKTIVAIIFILLLTACKEKYDYTANSIPELEKYLSGKPTNTPDNPYKIAMNGKFDHGLGRIKFDDNKYIILDMSGSTYSGINSYAFKYTDNVIKIIFGKSVAKIDKEAFDGCSALKSVIIPENGAYYIGDRAFYNCGGLTNISIPGSVTYIGDMAFYGCSSLNSIDVAHTNKEYVSIDGILYNKEKTELIQCPQRKTGNVVIPNSVTVIEESAFENCAGITGVTIPDGVISIGKRAFWKCAGLTGITIPDSVINIGEAAFYECTGLTDVTIGNSVTAIGENAFGKCTGLTSLNIPGSVVNIDVDAFSDCRNIVSVTVTDSVNVVLRGVFQDCVNLTNVILDNNITRVWDYAFSNFSSLKQITIPPGVEYIGDYAFFNCTGLTGITIPAKVKHIGDKAFRYYTGLTSVTFENTIPAKDFSKSAFNGNLRDKFYEKDKANGTPGMYTTAAPVGDKSIWTRR
jgi:hypothetical protein